jgi:hypothetical protein
MSLKIAVVSSGRVPVSRRNAAGRTANRAARPRRSFRSPFGIDVDREPERARRGYDSHLARAASLTEIPYFAQMFQMAPYLWGG